MANSIISGPASARLDTCQFCGDKFSQPGRGRPRKYCTPRCEKRSQQAKKTAKERAARIPLAPRECESCSAAYSPVRKGQRYCSVQCQLGPRVDYTYTCNQCGCQYHPKSKNRNKFCSRECAFEWQRIDRARRKAENAPILAERDHLRKEAQKAERKANRPIFERECMECGNSFTTHGKNTRFCSMSCGSRHSSRTRYELSVKPRPCRICGTEFTPVYGNKCKDMCSEECQRERARQLRRKYPRNHRSRARRYGVPYEPVNPLEVFERDKWRCHLCGERTPKRLRGTFDDRAPELDHIVPLAAGGAHSYANTACSCRACNMAKGATPMGQTMIDFAQI